MTLDELKRGSFSSSTFGPLTRTAKKAGTRNMAFTLTIDTDNTAFGEDDDQDKAAEVARILHLLADRLDEAVGGYLPAGGGVRDGNGATVGRWELTR